MINTHTQEEEAAAVAAAKRVFSLERFSTGIQRVVYKHAATFFILQFHLCGTTTQAVVVVVAAVGL